MLIRGKAKWAKVTGEPVWGFENKFKEWSIDIYVDDETEQKLVNEGLKAKIKDKGNGAYITFKRKEQKQDGTPNHNIRIVDHHGETMQDDSKDPPIVYKGPKIGNGSTINVNFAINEYGKGEKSANILSMQVWDLVKFDGGEFPTKEQNDDWSTEVIEEAAA